MSQTTRDLLIRAKTRISKRTAWTQHTYARDLHGGPVDVRSHEATSWCLLGAIRREVQPEGRATWGNFDRANALLRDCAMMPASSFNDSHTHDEVLALLDRAIEIA